MRFIVRENNMNSLFENGDEGFSEGLSLSNKNQSSTGKFCKY
jgi:hypothetical protein